MFSPHFWESGVFVSVRGHKENSLALVHTSDGGHLDCTERSCVWEIYEAEKLLS